MWMIPFCMHIGIENSFYQVFDYLLVCQKNGVTLNKDKFQFCQDSVEFAGLNITPSGICPSQKILTAIRDFPVPKTLTDARSWFGLVNQVAWAYSNNHIMQPFRDLVKPSSKFYWDEQLDKLFQSSKEIIVNQVKEGIKTFDLNMPAD